MLSDLGIPFHYVEGDIISRGLKAEDDGVTLDLDLWEICTCPLLERQRFL